MASDRSNIVNAVVTQVQTVTNVGQVYAYQRFSNNWTTYLQQFVSTIAGTKETLGWIVTLAPANAIVGTQDGEGSAFGQTMRTYNVQILGFLGLKDASNTEGTLLDLAESVMDALDKQINLGSLANLERYGCGPCTLSVYDLRQFGSVLCNYVEISYPVMVVKAVSYV